MLKTVKFGGSSLADAKQFGKAAAIIASDPSRCYAVVSAPGKRFDGDVKVTDLLYACCAAAQRGEDFTALLDRVRERYQTIADDLDLTINLDHEFKLIAYELRRKPNADYAASRGEYLSAKLMSVYLEWPMLDAADCVCFDADGAFDDEATQRMTSEKLAHLQNAVVPGFYGAMPDGSIHTFSRGGSDVTGAIVARASGSELYENWTDVSGLLCCDPRIVKDPEVIDSLSYTELRELAYMGASVLHESAIFPVKKAGIPINIRNTNAPNDPGTMIRPQGSVRSDRPVVGIAGRSGFSAIVIEKDQMNETVGFAMRVLELLSRHGILLEHMPTGIDTMSVVVASKQLAPCRERLLRELYEATGAEKIDVRDGLSIIAVVGQGMVRQRGVAGRLFRVLGEAGINVNMIDQGSDELNIITGVDDADFERAIHALYAEFFGR